MVIQHIPSLHWELTNTVQHGAEFWQVSTSSREVACRNGCSWFKGRATLDFFCSWKISAILGALLIESSSGGSNKTLGCKLCYLQHERALCSLDKNQVQWRSWTLAEHVRAGVRPKLRRWPFNVEVLCWPAGICKCSFANARCGGKPLWWICLCASVPDSRRHQRWEESPQLCFNCIKSRKWSLQK